MKWIFWRFLNFRKIRRKTIIWRILRHPAALNLQDMEWYRFCPQICLSLLFSLRGRIEFKTSLHMCKRELLETITGIRVWNPLRIDRWNRCFFRKKYQADSNTTKFPMNYETNYISKVKCLSVTSLQIQWFS